MNHFLKTCLLLFFLLCLPAGKALSLDIVLLSSKEIIPYQTCIEGIKAPLLNFSIQELNMRGDLARGREMLQEIRSKKPRLVIAVGPQAAFVLANDPVATTPRLFCMVLNPAKLLGRSNTYSGVSMNMSAAFQVQKIKEAFPDRKKIGVFYNRQSNQATITTFKREAAKHNLAIVPLAIETASEVPDIIVSPQFSIDVLLIIPDDQLNSTKIVEYIIKESLRKKIPVVGYNSWFAKNGALLSFIIDYHGTGRQTGRLAMQLLQPGPIENLIEAPEHIKINLDLKTANKLGVAISEPFILHADEVIK